MARNARAQALLLPKNAANPGTCSVTALQKFDNPGDPSDISVMTEITVTKPLPPAIERFVVHWGEMGTAWGVNRSVAQIHALLYLSDEPLTADDIAAQLAMARSNVSVSLRELLGWSLIRRVHAMGDRRDYYEAEADMFEMVRRIAQGRKAREIDPALTVLRSACGRRKPTSASRPARASGSVPCWSSPKPSTAASARSSAYRPRR
jgi:DNA-binding transcriptional regulator GbsR (MarR family)